MSKLDTATVIGNGSTELFNRRDEYYHGPVWRLADGSLVILYRNDLIPVRHVAGDMYRETSNPAGWQVID
jgi:hypothetical protein